MRGAIRAVLGGAASLVAASVGVHAWCAAIFLLLGFSLEETASLTLPATFLPALCLLERGLARVTRLFRPMGPIGAAQTGFFVAVALSAVWLHLIVERVFVAGNLGDMALAGLVFGIPSGLVAYHSAEAARNIVDTRI